MNDDFSPYDVSVRVIRSWWLVLLFMLLGAVCGLTIARLHKPVYESQSVISSTIDYSVTGILSEPREDKIYQAIGNVIISSDVIDAVISKTKLEGLGLTDEDIRDSFSVGRQDARWVLRTRASTPEIAVKLADYWSQAAMDALAEQKINSTTVQNAQIYLASLEECLSQSVVLDPVSSSCNYQNLPAIQAEIQRVMQDPVMLMTVRTIQLNQISFELTTTPTTPSSPVLFSQNLSTLFGSLIGLLIGLWLISAGLPGKLFSRGSK